MAPGVVLMLGLAFCLDQRIWAQTDLPEIYRDPPENGSLPIVIGTSVISVLPLLFLLLFLLCWCWCQAKHKAVDSETKSQGTYDSTSPGMDFPEETQCEVSVDTRPEEDRQMDTQVSLSSFPGPFPTCSLFTLPCVLVLTGPHRARQTGGDLRPATPRFLCRERGPTILRRP
ncbi:leukocyte immunoglobulin-like receptor subfamily B member 5 isoform X1 [Camelus ferus]|uniref:Leukocyte immunoglobulin-like receptor subfamily B member 5 isoform X1 n=2 Tax=Camelus TaxID=9836 RepID=A0A8B8TNM2_CAMFR|nr:leukocyte immunoglobulin-like receptor subfamily B member 5 isoform X1 [Camelus ferus]XP_045377823.1 leukocyte immunoglobulin-like receptor subfamily B member 5 isoform X1 [Camelus bactrianus]